MARSSTAKDAQALFHSLRSAYAATVTAIKIIDPYIMLAVAAALVQVGYLAFVGSFPFNSFLSGVLSFLGTVLSVDPRDDDVPSALISSSPMKRYFFVWLQQKLIIEVLLQKHGLGCISQSCW